MGSPANRLFLHAVLGAPIDDHIVHNNKFKRLDGKWAGGLGRGQSPLFTCKEPPDWHSNAPNHTRHGPSTPASLICSLALLQSTQCYTYFYCQAVC